MRFRRLHACLCFATVASAAVIAATSVQAQTPYDGQWNVTIVTKSGNCEPSTQYPLTVTDGKITAPGAAISGRVISIRRTPTLSPAALIRSRRACRRVIGRTPVLGAGRKPLFFAGILLLNLGHRGDHRIVVTQPDCRQWRLTGADGGNEQHEGDYRTGDQDHT